MTISFIWDDQSSVFQGYDQENEGNNRIVIRSYFSSEERKDVTLMNIGVYGMNLEEYNFQRKL